MYVYIYIYTYIYIQQSYLGLSENKVPHNPVLNHHSLISTDNFGGYPISRQTHMGIVGDT